MNKFFLTENEKKQILKLHSVKNILLEKGERWAGPAARARQYEITFGRNLDLPYFREFVRRVEADQPIFSRRAENGQFEYETQGYRNTEDFINDVSNEISNNPSRSAHEIIYERIERLNPNDRAKFDKLAAEEAELIIRTEYTNPGNETTIYTRQNYEQHINEQLDRLITANPEMTPTMIKDAIDAIEARFKQFIEGITGDATANSHYSDIPSRIKRERAPDNQVNQNTVDNRSWFKQTLQKITKSTWFKLNRIFEEITLFSRSVRASEGYLPDANINDSIRLIREYSNNATSGARRKQILEELRINLKTRITGETNIINELEAAKTKIFEAIDADPNLSTEAKKKFKEDFEQRERFNWAGGIQERVNWFNELKTDTETSLGQGETPKDMAVSERYGTGPFGFTKVKGTCWRLINLIATGTFKFPTEVYRDMMRYKGTTRAKWGKNYLFLMLLKYGLLPAIGSIIMFGWDAANCAYMSAKAKDPNYVDSLPDGWKEACSAYQKGGGQLFLYEIKDKIIGKLYRDITDIFKGNNDDNWFEEGPEWLNIVENVFDFLNPFSTYFDNIVMAYFDVQAWAKIMNSFVDKAEEVEDKVDNAVVKTKEEIEKLQDQQLSVEEKGEKQIIKTNMDAGMYSVVSDLKNTKGWRYILDNRTYNPDNVTYIVDDPLDDKIKYIITTNRNTTASIITGNGKEFSGGPERWEEFVKYINRRIQMSENQPINDSGPRNVQEEGYKIIYNKLKKMIKEESEGKKFGEDNFVHWRKTFTFQSYDPENRDWKTVKISAKQDEIEKWLDHYRKKYDEDDSFVRAVVHAFNEDKNGKNKIRKISFNKDYASLTEGIKPTGILEFLSLIRESKELEIWSVKYYSDGNWELVKGSYTEEELKNLGKVIQDKNKEQEERRNPVDGLKKKNLQQ